MALPEPIRSFCYAAWELDPGALRTRWGMVTADPRFPLIWDANNACVLEADPTLSPEAIREALHPVLHEAGVSFEHVEFWETSDRIPALRELRLGAAATRPDVVMVFDGGRSPAATSDRVEVLEVTDPDEKWEAQRALVDHVVHGRAADTRMPNQRELDQTTILAIPIEEASAKVRTGPPKDEEEDYDLPVWAGVLPLKVIPGDPEPDPKLGPGLEPPGYLTGYSRAAR